MYSITVRFSMMQVRMAVLYVLSQTYRILSTFMVATAIVVGFRVLQAINMVDANTLLSVTIGISLGLIGWIAIIAGLYGVNMRFVKRLVQALPSTSVTYDLSSEGCAVLSDAWNGFLPWHSFGRLVPRPYMWL